MLKSSMKQIFRPWVHAEPQPTKKFPKQQIFFRELNNVTLEEKPSKLIRQT